LLIGARQVLKVADFNSRHNWDNDFIWFLLGFWEHPSTICRSYPGETKEDTGFTGQAGQADFGR
jgi:hypothetical protein